MVEMATNGQEGGVAELCLYAGGAMKEVPTHTHTHTQIYAYIRIYAHTQADTAHILTQTHTHTHRTYLSLTHTHTYTQAKKFEEASHFLFEASDVGPPSHFNKADIMMVVSRNINEQVNTHTHTCIYIHTQTHTQIISGLT